MWLQHVGSVVPIAFIELHWCGDRIKVIAKLNNRDVCNYKLLGRNINATTYGLLGLPQAMTMVLWEG